MAYALFSPTACTNSGFSDIGDVKVLYNQNTAAASGICLLRVKGKNTGTLNFSTMNQVSAFGGLTPQTMPSNAIVTKVEARAVGYTTAITDPTCTVSIIDGTNGSSLASASLSSWGSATQDTFVQAAATISAASKKGIDWVKKLKVTFSVTGNYSSSVLSSDMYMEEVYLFVHWTVPIYTITTIASPEGGGIVSGGGKYESGSAVTITATPNKGYKFSHWLLNGVDTGLKVPEFQGSNISGDTTITAVFQLVSGILKVDYQDGDYENASFSVEYNPEGNESLLLSPPTKEGYTFIGWDFINNSGGSFVFIETEVGLHTEYYYGLIDGATDTLTAIWELDKTNKIYIGDKLIKEIYIGTNKVKEVYIGTTKIYG